METGKWKQRITICSFLFCLVGLTAALVILPKQTISKSERRRLAGKPEMTFENILNEHFMEDMETYLLDHFPFRDKLRRVKAYFAYQFLRQKENNDIYVEEGYAAKLEYPLKESEVKKAADKMKSLQAAYFPDEKVCYAVIPDKNYFLADKYGYPSMNYDKMLSVLRENLVSEQFQYIDIFQTLAIADYYQTDTHWRQEKLFDTADCIAAALGVLDDMNLDNTKYQRHEVADFYGVYYGQSALNLGADTLCYLTNDVIDSAYAWNMETNQTKPVYELEKLTDNASLDYYDIFLGGAVPLQIICSPKAATDKRLIVFRDSYASSLMPLFLGAYSEIVLVDLRYISSEMIGTYVDFEGADILFLYNTLVINNSSMLK